MVSALAAPTDKLAPDEARPVTASRRLLGMVSDVVVLGLLSASLSVAVSVAWAASGVPETDPTREITLRVAAFTPPFLQLVVVMATGRTIGESIVFLRPTPSLNRAEPALFGGP